MKTCKKDRCSFIGNKRGYCSVCFIEKNKWCYMCHMKLKMEGQLCKCGLTFCIKHRLPFDHNCDINRHLEHKERLYKQNPVVKKAKLEKL